MSSLVNNNNNRPPPQEVQQQPIFESESTEAQRETEKECQPYYIPLESLPPDQLDHLRQTGLLSSPSSSSYNNNNNNNNGSNDNDTNNNNNNNLDIQLLREKHIEYLSQVWQRSLKSPFVSLDSSRPWIMYWCLHGCDLLNGFPNEDELCKMVSTLQQCWSEYTIDDDSPPVTKEQDPFYYSGMEEDTSTTSVRRKTTMIAGGFGGGPQQMPHAATTYAAVLALCIIATGRTTGSSTTSTEQEDAIPTTTTESMELAIDCLKQIRIPMYRWMVSLLNDDTGGYRMHHDGEVDVRASYTVLCCAKLLNIDTPQLTQPKVAQFIANCQTFEGGIGGEPWSEAHGGYAFCGVAALKILGKLHILDVDALLGWLTRRQLSFEGGFSGRSNKLVDGCYSFWQGSAMAITSSMYSNNNNNNTADDKNPFEKNYDDDPWMTTMMNNNNNNNDDKKPPFPLLFDAPMLERYILLCAQDIHGGLRDKPSKSRDFYHSCYNLSGLSVAQHCDTSGEVYGDAQQSIVHQTHPCYNIRIERAKAIITLFSKL